MYIKNIFNIQNYKGLSDGFKVDLDDITYLIGDNGKSKTTIGSLPLWIMTGYNLYGGNKEQIGNDSIIGNKDSVASMTIIDNDGTEHTITRSKGKNNFVLLDGIRTTQEMLTKFYGDIHTLICAYNPRYFRSMAEIKQRELLLRVLPVVSSEDAFQLLDNAEREVLGQPIVDTKGYCQAQRANIKELNSELDKVEGSKKVYTDIALKEEGVVKEFTKQEELNQLEKQYEQIISNTDNLVHIEDLQQEINKLERKINENVNIELKELKEKQQKELEKLENVSSVKSNCPVCKQKIKNEKMIEALKTSYKNSVNDIAKKIEELKEETREMIAKRSLQIEQYKRMKSPEMQEKMKKVDELKAKIELLQKEKNDINLYNKEICVKNAEISNAKKKLEELKRATEEINKEIEKCKKQLQVATKLSILMIKEQMGKVSQYLNKVTIEFCEVDERTGEIIDESAYIVKYDGRRYEKLSTAYKLKADIEIANLINKVSGINTPVFIDEVETITEIEFKEDTQVILAIVIKYNQLEVLYSYDKVLQKEKKSIERQIEESNNLLQIAE